MLGNPESGTKLSVQCKRMIRERTRNCVAREVSDFRPYSGGMVGYPPATYTRKISDVYIER